MKRNRSQGSLRTLGRGSFLIVAAVWAGVAVSICAIAIGLSHYALQRARMKSLAGTAGIAAAQGFSAKLGSQTDKLNAAVAAANLLLSKNSDSSLDLKPLDANSVVPGIWQSSKPTGSGEPENKFPRFLRISEANTAIDGGINAFQVTLETQSSAGLFLPFAAIFGTSHLAASETAVASVTPRCVQFLLDVSGSTVAGPANVPPGYGPAQSEYGGPTFRAGPGTNQPWGAFAYYVDPSLPDDFFSASPTTSSPRLDRSCGPNVSTRPATTPSELLPGGSKYDKMEGRSLRKWCSYKWRLEIDGSAMWGPYRDGTAGDGSNVHTSDGYREVRTPFGRYLVNVSPAGPPARQAGKLPMQKPEPLLSFLNGFNAGANKLAEQAVSGDRIGITAFADKIISKTGLMGSPALIQQITNYDNFIAQESPNFVDWKLFPDAETDGTNLLLAFRDAIRDLNDPNICPTNARKIIVLATDGISNCVDTTWLQADAGMRGQYCLTNINDCANSMDWNKTTTSTEPHCFTCGTAQRYACEGNFTPYRVSEEQLVKTRSYQTLNPPEVNTLSELINSRITVTTLHAGGDPNISNRWYVDHYLDPIEAPTWGFDGLPYNAGTNFKPFVKWSNWSNAMTSTTDDLFWADDADRRTDSFVRSTGLMAEIAFRTGGYYCPLLNRLSAESYVDHDLIPSTPLRLKDHLRRADQILRDSIENRTKAEQAQDCVARTIGLNPFAIQEAWR